MDSVRFGIAGCGMIAHFHAGAINAVGEARLVGVYDSYKPGADAFGKKYGAHVYGTFEQMASSGDVDAICVCTPSGLHTPLALEAVGHGKHVVVEKPMSLTLAEADALIGAAGRMGVKVCVISQFRLAPAVQEMRRAIDIGAFGKIVMADLSMKYCRTKEYYASAGWRGTYSMDGGGALMNQGIHGVDVLRYLMGPVKKVSADMRTLVHSIEVEDCAAATLEFASGALGVITATTGSSPGYPRRLEICGGKGSAVLEEDSIMRWDLPIECAAPVGRAADNVASSDPGAISPEGHIRQIKNMADSVLHGDELLVDARGGRLPLEIILAIYESANTGKTVYLG